MPKPNPKPSDKSKKITNGNENGNGPDEEMEFPTQDPSERREIRLHYRQMLDDATRCQYDLINPENDDLNARLNDAEELFSKVKMTREAALDSQYVALISRLGKQKAQALHTNIVEFECVEYAEKLITFLSGGEVREVEHSTKISANGWARLGEAVQPFFKRSPALRFMFGSFERGEPTSTKRVLKEKKDELTNDKDAGGKKAQPKQLQNFEENKQAEATTEIVDSIYHRLIELYDLNEHAPICYFEFITNPLSFGQTIENMFYTSFLVKDGHARITLDETKLPVIEPVERSKAGTEQSNLKRHQVVMTMNVDEWKEVIETFEIQDSLIETREKVILEDQVNEAMLGQSQDESSTSFKGKGKGKSSKR